MPRSWAQTLLPPTAVANVSIEANGAGLHGQAALHIDYRSGSGLVGLGNRGFKNEGIYLVGGKVYDGYLFVKSKAAVKVKPAGAARSPRSYARPRMTGGVLVLRRSICMPEVAGIHTNSRLCCCHGLRRWLLAWFRTGVLQTRPKLPCSLPVL